jgi:hypothetical protein
LKTWVNLWAYANAGWLAAANEYCSFGNGIIVTSPAGGTLWIRRN